jgi:hypothetical protein
MAAADGDLSMRRLGNNRYPIELYRDARCGNFLDSNHSTSNLYRGWLGRLRLKYQRQLDLSPLFDQRFRVEEDTAIAQVSTDTCELKVSIAVISNRHRPLYADTV